MYSPDWNNKFFRAYAVVTDKYGIDPLLDKIVPEVLKIKQFRNHEVTQEERGAADLISLREYGSEDFWWHILTYNGICRFRDIVEGLTLKIPDLGAITAITNQTLVVQNSTGQNNIVVI